MGKQENETQLERIKINLLASAKTYSKRIEYDLNESYGLRHFTHHVGKRELQRASEYFYRALGCIPALRDIISYLRSPKLPTLRVSSNARYKLHMCCIPLNFMDGSNQFDDDTLKDVSLACHELYTECTDLIDDEAIKRKQEAE